MKNTKLLAGVMALVLVAGLGAPAFAQLNAIQETSSAEPNRPLSDEDNVIFDGGTADFSIGFFHLDNPNQLMMDDFELAEDEILADVHLDVRENVPFDAEFEYVIYADNGAGFPDLNNILQAGQGVNEHKMLIPNTSLDFRYWFDLDNPLPLSAGQKYWIQLFVTNSPSLGNIGWWVTTPGFGESCKAVIPTGLATCESHIHLNLVLTGQEVVGGEFLPIDTTALVLAGIQDSAVWMIPTLAGIAGAGFYLIKFRTKKE